MPIQIIREDITKLRCDAIVNAANNSLLGGGGVDGAIHRAAGKGLLLECMKLKGCKTGQAKITGAYKLPCKYVIHTVGPVWRGGTNGEKELLESCYRESLQLAKEYECESVAFPLISSGVYGYPKDQALRVAIDVISAFLLENDMLVYVVIFDKAAYKISEKLFADIKEYIDDHYVETHTDAHFERMRGEQCSQILEAEEVCFETTFLDEPVTQQVEPVKELSLAMPKQVAKFSLEDKLGEIDESFSEMLLRKIDEKGMTDSECYKKANVDRKLFSKIRNNVHYSPSKTTAIAFAIALELNLEETKDMLMKAGFALSHSNKFDLIIEYFIQSGNYNIFEINEALFMFDQSLLGM
ncbi:MAG: O-acetyl-ADP-ribose deacetylase [Tyzzerella sp.]|nr:O-acetyl-ADP-ribose deacetylase [Tyzzerella sp.]